MFPEEPFHPKVIRGPPEKVDQLVDLADALHRQRQSLHDALERLNALRRFSRRRKKLFGHVAPLVLVRCRRALNNN